MSSKIELPEGLTAQEAEGSGALQPLLDNLKRYSFQGYLKLRVQGECEGYLILKKGLPRNALYHDLVEDKVKKGIIALQDIHTLDSNDDLQITVHTDIDVDKLIEEVGGKLPARGSKKSTKPPPSKKSSDTFLHAIERSGDDLKGLPEDILEEFPPRYTFKNFIVGPNNRFAYAAALSVAGKPGRSYNPLFITSKTGLGKTHLLKAIGRTHLVDDKDRKGRYVVTSRLIDEIKEHKRKNKMSELRKKYLDTDTLLLDGVQSLANKEQIQEDIFNIFSELQERGSQIVLSSDRIPEEIPEIEEKLISRFRSGLVVDILAPGYQTRKIIIEHAAEEQGLDLPEDVIIYMAKKIKGNVNTIKGALNRVSAYSSLMDKPISLENIEGVLTRYIDKEVGTGDALKPQFKPGRSYIIEEETTPLEGLRLVDEMSPKKNKFIISRMNPEQIKEDYELINSEVAWLTDKKSEEQKTVPPNLERLSWMLEEQIKKTDVVFIDGLEDLISNTNFDAAIQFIRHIVDVVSESETIFLVIVNPRALESKQIYILEREMDVISYIS